MKKLITLNIWGGHVKNPLLNFILTHQNTDFLCLQEVYHQAENKISTDERYVTLNIFDEIRLLLPNHQALFKPVVGKIYGIGMFVKKSIEIVDEGTVSIYTNADYLGEGPAHSRILQWVKCLINEQIHYILNVHGLWNGRGKTDTPERILQSENIKKFLNTLEGRVILCGDFNLRPDTQSLKILSQGMKNLIDIYKISSTRTSLYPKEERYADYVFTSPEIEIKHFDVLKDEVSDHAPLLLEFV